MRFSELLEAAGVAVLERQGDADVSGVVADSRQAMGGACFIAVRGSGADGHDYVAQAVANGCAAVICEDASGVPGGVPFARVARTALAAGPVAQAMLGWPARRLTLVGATGTKGKTTFTYLVRHILRAAGHETGLIGTIRYEYAGRAIPAPNTTPGPVELAALMSDMALCGATHVAIEVSSHALDQGRVEGLPFATAAFTNLSGDHLDYHRTMEEYLEAKALLFRKLHQDAVAALNAHDPAAPILAVQTPARVLWYGIAEGDANDAPPLTCDSGALELAARIRRLDGAGSEFDLVYEGRSQRVVTDLLGRHNVLNALAAAAACLPLGVPLATIAEALGRPVRVPGRLDRVPALGPFQVVVDYAHTDDSLANALRALRPVTAGRLIVLFGCGGDRDRTKRPRMARVAEQLADLVVVTSDNPRTEDPLQIINGILGGFSDLGRRKLVVEPDRATAIKVALARALPGDLVLLAGKGHEDYQIIGKTKHHFDDREVAQAIMRERFGDVVAEAVP